MARTRATITTTVWSDLDFRDLSPEAKLTYVTLLSQPTLSLAGCLDFVPERWATLTGYDVASINGALHELEQRRYIAVDRSTFELVLRSFVLHDIGATPPNSNLAKGMWAAWALILSPDLKALVARNVPEAWFDRDDVPEAARELRFEPPEPTPKNPGSDGGSNPGSDGGSNGGSNGGPNLPSTATATATDRTHVGETPTTNGQPEAVSRVFDAWVASTHRAKGRTKLDAKRRRCIVAALKAYPVDDVLDAVDGWRFSPHHRGENAQHTTYNDLELLLRNSSQIEKFRDLKRAGPPPLAAVENLAEGSNFG